MADGDAQCRGGGGYRFARYEPLCCVEGWDLQRTGYYKLWWPVAPRLRHRTRSHPFWAKSGRVRPARSGPRLGRFQPCFDQLPGETPTESAPRLANLGMDPANLGRLRPRLDQRPNFAQTRAMIDAGQMWAKLGIGFRQHTLPISTEHSPKLDCQHWGDFGRISPSSIELYVRAGIGQVRATLAESVHIGPRGMRPSGARGALQPAAAL